MLEDGASMVRPVPQRGRCHCCQRGRWDEKEMRSDPPAAKLGSHGCSSLAGVSSVGYAKAPCVFVIVGYAISGGEQGGQAVVRDPLQLWILPEPDQALGPRRSARPYPLPPGPGSSHVQHFSLPSHLRTPTHKHPSKSNQSYIREHCKENNIGATRDHHLPSASRSILTAFSILSATPASSLIRSVRSQSALLFQTPSKQAARSCSS